MKDFSDHPVCAFKERGLCEATFVAAAGVVRYSLFPYHQNLERFRQVGWAAALASRWSWSGNRGWEVHIVGLLICASSARCSQVLDDLPLPPGFLDNSQRTITIGTECIAVMIDNTTKTENLRILFPLKLRSLQLLAKTLK